LSPPGDEFYDRFLFGGLNHAKRLAVRKDNSASNDEAFVARIATIWESTSHGIPVLTLPIRFFGEAKAVFIFIGQRRPALSLPITTMLKHHF